MEQYSNLRFLYSTITEGGQIETVVEIDGEQKTVKGGTLEPGDLAKLKKKMKPAPLSIGTKINGTFCSHCGEEVGIDEEHDHSGH